MEVIRLDHVSLWRRTQEEFSYDLKKIIFSLLEGTYQKPSKTLVLDDVSMVVHKGERLGIIGSNGAGKSTLLKIICGILRPSSGGVKVAGSIAPLIELGAGFDTELSIVDNIMLYGILLGFSKRDMGHRIASILEFAELESYADAPLKSLSSGMKARLGFSVATDVKPDVLILDEVFSVGDIRFRHKCHQRLERFWQTDTTVLVVSHDLDFIRQSCQKTIWLHNGQISFAGPSDYAIEQYLSVMHPDRSELTVEMIGS